jgi:hypothetical protein
MKILGKGVIEKFEITLKNETGKHGEIASISKWKALTWKKNSRLMLM